MDSSAIGLRRRTVKAVDASPLHEGRSSLVETLKHLDVHPKVEREVVEKHSFGAARAYILLFPCFMLTLL